MRALTAIACGTLLGLLGCADAPPPPAASTTTATSPPVAPAPEPEPAAAPVPPSPAAPLTSPEDARRMLQERGIDPDQLSAEVGEQMQRRFRRPE